MTQEQLTKLVELLENKSLVEKIKNGSVEQALELLKEEGLELTKDEFKAGLEMITQINTEGELPENELENVAGGIVWIRPKVFPKGKVKEYLRQMLATAQGIWDGFFGH